MEPSGKMSVCGKETDTIISTQNRNEKKKAKSKKKKNATLSNSDKLLCLWSHSSHLIIHSVFLWMHTEQQRDFVTT